MQPSWGGCERAGDDLPRCRVQPDECDPVNLLSGSKLPPAKVVRVVEAARYRIGQLHRRMLPSPAVMMELLANAWVAQAITAAADLGIADALANGPLTAQEFASAIDADADAVSRLLRALISRGIFRQRRDGRYDLTPLADTLRSDAEVSLAAMARFMGLPDHREMWSHLTDAIRTGEAAIPKLRGKSGFELLADDPALSEVFNQAMTSISDSRSHRCSPHTTSVVTPPSSTWAAGMVGCWPRSWRRRHRRVASCSTCPEWCQEPRPSSPNTMSPTELASSRDRFSTPCPAAATFTCSRM